MEGNHLGKYPDSPILITCNSVIRLSTLIAQDLIDEVSNRFRLFLIIA